MGPTEKRRGPRLLAVALAGLMGTALLPGGVRAQGTLNVATWGGAYGQSQEIAFFEPFAKETGTVIATQVYDGDLAKLKSMIAGDTPVDVVDVSEGALRTLCKDGLLETIDASSLGPAPDGGSAAVDFIAGGLTDCGVASVAWSTAVAFDRQAFSKDAPAEIGALLDTARFPGKRALPKNPRYTLELALLADGVPPEDIYRELGTQAGADRAFAALDKIKGDVMLWSKAEQPITWLLDKKATMAAGYSGRIFRAAVGDRHIGILWDGQIYDIDAWAIPKTANSKDEAMRFIGFATSPARLAEQAGLIAYGPMRKSALPLVGRHPVLNVEMQEFLPTSPENFKKALKFDEAWWNQNGAALAKRFAAWQAEVEGASAPPKATDAASEEAAGDAAP